MILVMVLSLIVQQMLQSRFNKYSKVPTANGMSGAEVAQKMLNDEEIKSLDFDGEDPELLAAEQ